MQTSAVTTTDQRQQAVKLEANQLSSGKRITSAAIDPSGLAIANELYAQATGFEQGARNAQDAVNASTVADGAIATISEGAQHLYTLSVAANNDLLSTSDRADLQTEANQTAHEINSVASTTQFNGVKLLDASTPTLSVQTGAGEGDTTVLPLPANGTGALGLSNIDLSSSASATASESSADSAISTIATGQATLGSQTVALQFAEKNSENERNNVTAAASNIDDANIAQTSTNYANDKTGSQIQADLAVQAHLAASSVLGLFPS